MRCTDGEYARSPNILVSMTKPKVEFENGITFHVINVGNATFILEIDERTLSGVRNIS